MAHKFRRRNTHSSYQYRFRCSRIVRTGTRILDNHHGRWFPEWNSVKPGQGPHRRVTTAGSAFPKIPHSKVWSSFAFPFEQWLTRRQRLRHGTVACRRFSRFRRLHGKRDRRLTSAALKKRVTDIGRALKLLQRIGRQRTAYRAFLSPRPFWFRCVGVGSERPGKKPVQYAVRTE